MHKWNNIIYYHSKKLMQILRTFKWYCKLYVCFAVEDIYSGEKLFFILQCEKHLLWKQCMIPAQAELLKMTVHFAQSLQIHQQILSDLTKQDANCQNLGYFVCYCSLLPLLHEAQTTCTHYAQSHSGAPPSTAPTERERWGGSAVWFSPHNVEEWFSLRHICCFF